MAKQITIKQISQMSGVSAGTVDRILHNRGKVSDEARAKVEQVLSKAGYRYNIHTSAVSLKRGYHVAVVLPTVFHGSYWSSVEEGIEKARDEYSDIDISIDYVQYDQYDLNSSLAAYARVLACACDAVVIAGTFESETVNFCHDLDGKGIPYVFLDTRFEGCREVGSFTADQYRCGRVLGSMLDRMCAPDSTVCVVRAARLGSVSSFNTLGRYKGITEYFRDSANHRKVNQFFLNLRDGEDNTREFADFLRQNPDIGALAVLNSRGYVVADILRDNGLGAMVLGCFDSTTQNLERLKNGSLSFILCQHPQEQGFFSLQRLIEYLLYKTPPSSETSRLFPIEIVIKEMI